MDPNVKNRTAIMIEENGIQTILIRFPYDLDLLYKIRSITGRKYNKDERYWTAPVYLESLKSLVKWDFTLDDRLQFFLKNSQLKEAEIIEKGIKGLKGNLFLHQSQGVAFIEDKKGRVLIDYDTGLGKTALTIAWLQMHPEKRPVVIVVPSYLKLFWKREVERWMEAPKIEILFGSTKSWIPTGDIIIVALEEISVWTNKLKTIDIQVLILDEIQKIKDKSANQTKTIIKIGKYVPHIICLTGISIAARPLEAFTAIKLISPKLFPSYAAFSGMYGDTKPTYLGWESYGGNQINRSSIFKRSEEKITEFMGWLQEQVDKGLIEIVEYEQIGDAIESEWTNKYIADSYKRKELRSRYELAKDGIRVPSGNAKNPEINLSTPFHIDRVGLLFTRVFSELPGISTAMDAVISRILAQGMADGEGPAKVARKLEAVFNGSGLKDLGITKEFLADTIISSKRRAKMLAHTEMMRAYHQSTIQEYRNWIRMGIDVKAEWKTAGDNRVCELCLALEGKIFSVDEIEDMIPLHPECRCIALPYIEELQKYETKPKEDVDWLGSREGISTRYTHVPELYKMLTDTIMIRRLKKDVSQNLPKKIYSFIPVELDNINEYKKKEKIFAEFVQNEKELNEVASSSYKNPMIFIEELIYLAIKGKIRRSIDWIKDFHEIGNKLIVFSSHQLIIEALTNTFSNVLAKFDNSSSDEEINSLFSNFENDPDLRLFVVDKTKLKTKIKLTIASHIVFTEIPVSYEDYIKTKDGTFIAQPNIFINIYYLFGAETIEEILANYLDKREFDSRLDPNKIETVSYLSMILDNLKNKLYA